MKVQKIRLAPDFCTWIVLGPNYLPIEPITSFIRYLNNTDKSPHTMRAYANHLKLYWEYLLKNDFDWKTVKLDCLAGFVGWLRQHDSYTNVISISGELNRKSSTINSILGCISSFYQYNNHLGVTDVHITEAANLPGSRYKALLYHVLRKKPVQRRIISLKQYKNIPKTISDSQFESLINFCTNARDRFLISLLFETGLRIGQALLLRHEDIISWDNEIHIIPREESLNEAQNKSKQANVIHVSTKLMRLYNKYANSINPAAPLSYALINLKEHSPLRYPAVRKLFSRLSIKAGFKITPHMLRHTHATNLINSGWDPSLVQRRLGHSSIQTTLDIYSHVDQKALKAAFKEYQSHKEVK